MMTFSDLGLKEQLLEALNGLGFETPTEIQEKAIPELLKTDTDFVGLAQTGTGKTAAFGLPMLHRTDGDSKQTQALILSPTRELCIQISKELKQFAAKLKGVRIVPVYGGASIEMQKRDLNRGAQIIVATPGRLMDMIQRGYVDLSQVSMAILDEADEMLNMGFVEDIEEILSETPDTKNTWLFSATMPQGVARIARKFMKDPVEVTIGRKNESNANIDHRYYLVDGKRRFSALKRLMDASPDMYAIVFCNTRIDTQRVASKLIEMGYPAAALHGDLSQSQRDLVMNGFRHKQTRILVATDIAARGIDVQNITHVFHYYLPDDIENYTHRSGRTARAGNQGYSMIIATKREASKIPHIQRVIKSVIHKHQIPSGFEICEIQLKDKLNNIDEVTMNEDLKEKYWDMIEERLSGYSREEIIQKMVGLEFNDLLERYSNEDDLNIMDSPDQSGGKGSRYFATIGSKDGQNWKSLKDLLAQEFNIKNKNLFRVEVRDSFSFFSVDEGIDVPEKFFYNDREVRIEIASKGGGRSGGGGGGRGRGKGDFKRKDGKRKFSDKGGKPRRKSFSDSRRKSR